MDSTFSPTVQFRPVATSEVPMATALLSQASLIVSDISEKVQLFGLFEHGGALLAVGGLEVFGDLALLRSVCVAAEEKGKGYGKRLVHMMETNAAMVGISTLFLLTTTARSYFESLGYRVTDRNTAPDAIKQTSEFSGLCPSSAVFMCKPVTC